jgi:two-component system response regulator RegX3
VNKDRHGQVMKVLIISNRASLTQPLRAYLEQAGFEVWVAGDGSSGLSLAQHQDPDLVLLELARPGLDGLDVCRQLRRDSSVPLIVLGPCRVADTVAALQLGADDYVACPCSLRELLAHIRALLRRTKVNAGFAQKHAPAAAHG